jgi:hypothetical protein
MAMNGRKNLADPLQFFWMMQIAETALPES